MKPILFNTEMVKAILDGRKATTRRVIKPQPVKFVEVSNGLLAGCRCDNLYPDYGGRLIKCPYEKGDILYVRETFCSAYDGEAYFYFADKCTNREQKKLLDYDDVCWRPSIHMPKEAARIFLKVTEVRAERLQDIDDEGAKSEGANINAGFEEKMRQGAIDRFAEIWNSTVKKSDLGNYGWNANPWVWVISFERSEKEGAVS